MPLQYNQGYTTGGGVGGGFTPMMGESSIGYGNSGYAMGGVGGGRSQSTGQISSKHKSKFGTTAGADAFRKQWDTLAQRRQEGGKLSKRDYENLQVGEQMGFYHGAPSPTGGSPSMQGLQAAAGGGGGGSSPLPYMAQVGGAGNILEGAGGGGSAGTGVSGGEGLSAPGEGGEAYGPAAQISGPNPLRQGIGTRLLPTQSAALAGLRRAY